MTTEPTILLFYLNPLEWSYISAPPYGLEVLSASVENLGANIVIHSPFLHREPDAESQRLIESLDPALIGLSLKCLDNLVHVWDTQGEFNNGIQSYSFLPEVEQAISVIRQNTSVPIVIGGSGFSIAPVKLLQKFGLQMGVVGSGETTFRQLVQAVLRGQDIEEFVMREAASLPGMVVLKDSEVVVNNDPVTAPFESELPSLKRVPEYDSWTQYVPVRVNEGCPGHCAFCVEADRYAGVTWRPPEQIVAEMAELNIDKSSAVWFACSEFNLPDEKHAIDLCRQITSAQLPEMSLYAFFLPRPFSPDLYYALREAGFADYGICFDILHPSDRVLERNNIGFRRRDIDKLVDNLLKVGVSGFSVGFMLGMPGETEETLNETAEWVHEMDTLFGETFYCTYNCGARVYPGTELERIAKAEAQNGVLYGADDPDCLMPVVYSAPWSPRRIDEFFRAACADCQGVITNYHKGDPMFEEVPEVVIAWQYALARRSTSDLEGAVQEFRQALSLAKNPVVQDMIADAMASCLIGLGRFKEARGLSQYLL